jgi:hypothetical protein
MSTNPTRDGSGSNRFFRSATPGTPPLQPQTGPTQRLKPLGRVEVQPTRERRTRRTIDLPLPMHRALDVWQRETADRLGFARVTGQEVLTALIDQLLTDPRLSAEVTRRIRERR